MVIYFRIALVEILRGFWTWGLNMGLEHGIPLAFEDGIQPTTIGANDNL